MGRCPDEIRQCEAGGSGLQRKRVWEGAVVNGSLLLRRGCLGAAWNVRYQDSKYAIERAGGQASGQSASIRRSNVV